MTRLEDIACLAGIACLVGSLLPGLARAASADDSETVQGVTDCNPHVDLVRHEVVAMGREAMRDGDQWRISGCRLMPALGKWVLARDLSCPLLPSPLQQVVRQQSRLIYHPSSSETIEVAPCAPHDGDHSYPMRETAEGCPVQHQWEQHSSLFWTKWVADIDGKTVDVTNCTISTKYTVPHRSEACPDLRTAEGDIHQVRIVISPPPAVTSAKPNDEKVILGCQPSGSDNASLTVSNDPCDGSSESARKYFHDPKNRQSMRGRMFYAGNTAITNCLPDPDNVAAISEVTDSWQHNEQIRFSRPSTRLVMQDGEENIPLTQPVPSLRQIPWRMSTQEVVTVSQAKLACAVFDVKQARTTWLRPDGQTVTTQEPAQSFAGLKARLGTNAPKPGMICQ